MSPTPRKALYREHSVTVYRYDRETPATLETPILIIPSLVNKACIMDLLEGESFIAGMLERGAQVYLLEWGEPNLGQQRYSLQFYLKNYIGRAIRRILKDSGASGVTLAGYCLGGTMSLLYAALDVEDQVKNLVTMVTPAGFEDRGMLSWWARREHFNVDSVVNAFGNIPAQFFSSVFPWIVPTSSFKKIRTIYEKHDDDEFLTSFLALDLWITENVPFPGQVYREVITKGYQENTLVKSRKWQLDDRMADLEDIQIPVLNVTAKYDHVSPVESCDVLTELVGSLNCTSLVYETGHLGPALGRDKLGVHTDLYWDDIQAWLKDHD